LAVVIHRRGIVTVTISVVRTIVAAVTQAIAKAVTQAIAKAETVAAIAVAAIASAVAVAPVSSVGTLSCLQHFFPVLLNQRFAIGPCSPSFPTFRSGK
jgi:hypothetical protein